MRRTAVPECLVVAALLIGVLACANPADDKPEAVVGEPVADVPAPTGERWVVSEESSISWIGSKITGSHDGGFNSFQGEILLVDGKPEVSSVSVEIDTTSLWADDPKLTNHLKSPDFFEVETYPNATFTSTGITRGEQDYTITGNLTLHGVTKSISFPASIEIAEDRITASAEFFIQRFDFGIVYPGKPDDLIRDEVVIKLDLTAEPAA